MPPTYGEPIEVTPITPGVGDIHEAEGAASQPSQPISMGSHIGSTGHVVQEDLPPIQNVVLQSLERSIEPEERIMT